MPLTSMFRRTEGFDYLVGDVPWHMPEKLAEIAVRSRVLLQGQTLETLSRAAQALDCLIEDHFLAARAELTGKILEGHVPGLEYLPKNQHSADGVSALLDEWPDDAGVPVPYFPDSHNTSDFQALLDCIDIQQLNEWSSNEGWEEAHYYAVLCLYKVGECIRSASRLGDTQEADQAVAELLSAVTGEKDWPRSISDQRILKHLTEAVEAVCWAERQQDYAKLVLTIEQLGGEKAAAEHLIDAKVQEGMSAHMSKLSARAARVRHGENRAMKAQIWEWCETNLADYDGAESAAEALVYVIKLVPLKYRAVYDHIRQWKKQQRRALTP